MDDFELRGNTHTFVIEPPVTQFPLWEAQHYFRNLYKFTYPDTEVEIECEIDPNLVVQCQNGIQISPKQIPGAYVYTPEYRLEKYAQLKYFLDKLEGLDAKIYSEMIERINPWTVTLLELYQTAIAVYNNPVIDRLKVLFVNPITETSSSDGKLSPGEAQCVFREYATIPISKLPEDDYICIAALHLFFWFAGGEQLMIDKNDLKIQPLAIQMFGQHLWLMLHYLCPNLEKLYKKTIAKNIRLDDMKSISIFHFRCGDSFVIDFWQAWSYHMGLFDASFIRWYESNYGELNGSHTRMVASQIKKKPEHEVTQEDMKYVVSALSRIHLDAADMKVANNNKLAEQFQIEPMTFVFYKCALHLYDFYKSGNKNF